MLRIGSEISMYFWPTRTRRVAWKNRISLAAHPTDRRAGVASKPHASSL
jgi:hypothetical protein